ncbi:MAG: hypothetical protein BWY75_01899 [bacterium ADurb.Bin425]|nr:MAG: hypothetical protein BWY75_01899 [bacterium ADurb.Bin425]
MTDGTVCLGKELFAALHFFGDFATLGRCQKRLEVIEFDKYVTLVVWSRWYHLIDLFREDAE